jgi:hypothetical protein
VGCNSSAVEPIATIEGIKSSSGEPIYGKVVSETKSPLEEPIEFEEDEAFNSSLEGPIVAFACDLVITGIIGGIKVTVQTFSEKLRTS